MKKVLWLVFGILFVIPLVLSYPYQTYKTTYQSITKFTYIDNYASCEDTDIPSYNPFMRGVAITKGRSYWGFPINYRHEDKCQGIFLLEETYCIGNEVKKVVINCEVFGDYACFSGECVYTGSIPGWDGIPHE